MVPVNTWWEALLFIAGLEFGVIGLWFLVVWLSRF